VAVEAAADAGAFCCAAGGGSDFEHAAAIDAAMNKATNRQGRVTSLIGVA